MKPFPPTNHHYGQPLERALLARVWAVIDEHGQRGAVRLWITPAKTPYFYAKIPKPLPKPPINISLYFNILSLYIEIKRI
jgi:hypothetical protein